MDVVDGKVINCHKTHDKDIADTTENFGAP